MNGVLRMYDFANVSYESLVSYRFFLQTNALQMDLEREQRIIDMVRVKRWRIPLGCKLGNEVYKIPQCACQWPSECNKPLRTRVTSYDGKLTGEVNDDDIAELYNNNNKILLYLCEKRLEHQKNV
jgi:hypothetical protein